MPIVFATQTCDVDGTELRFTATGETYCSTCDGVDLFLR
jgi:uncharacterized Zn finger protein (UPF0148 family)